MSGDPAATPILSEPLPRVGLLLATVGDLSGSGGTERQFSDLFDYLRRRAPGRVQLVTAAIAVRRLREAGRLQATDDIVALPLGERPASTKWSLLWFTCCLLLATIRHRWDIVHICQPTTSYLPYAAIVTRLPKWLRPRVTMTVVDCTLAHNLLSNRAADVYEQQVVDAHRWYDRWTRLDGIYSWYRAFTEAASQRRMFDGTLIRSAAFCFTNVDRFVPALKQPLVLYAGRLSAQKRPLLFVDAIASLFRRHGPLTAGWRFAMYGGGVLEADTRARIEHHGLGDRLALHRTPDMSTLFAISKLFVSTQAYENFTSQSMLEAMSAGNAIVAENAGQTSEFIKHGQNGYAIDPPATADAFADAIADYLAHPETHDRLAAASRQLVVAVHNIDHFAGDITAFWTDVLRDAR
jgi:glycosyltransferase involved in cell wall biosynthesis